jgi:hypothetical protein
VTREEYEQRRKKGRPIESGRELVHALDDVRKLVDERSALWYLMNRLTRTAMAFADDEERKRTIGGR